MSSSIEEPYLRVEYSHPHQAILTWFGDGPWDHLRGMLLSYSRSTRLLRSNRASLLWGELTGLILEIRSLRTAFPFDVDYSDEARERLARSVDRISAYNRAATTPPISVHEAERRLSLAGFTRQLTNFQERNLCQLLRLPSGASFSVPGAGKTTEALAYFFANASDDESLLVVAPKNAFPTWEEQLVLCNPNIDVRFVRLRGGLVRITEHLALNPRFMLITYQQLARVRDIVADYLANHSTAIFLDESHRIKAVHGVTTESVLSIAHLSSLKLVLSGTPMPQQESDLLPQFSFLFPEVDHRGKSPVSLCLPIYVRTTKPELGLRPPDRRCVSLPMNPLQQTLYDLLRSESARQTRGLNLRSRREFRQLGRAVVRLLQFASDPALLSEELGSTHPELVRAVIREGDGPKIRWTCQRVRELVRNGHKVIVWTGFVQNVELMASRLVDLGTEYIHGGVESGDEDETDSREAKIRRFHDASMVLVANPAAASEGISLHDVCHHAIFLDRSFNAAHYIQAEDRIHRLGLSPDQQTNIEIVECEGSIDEVVRTRLNLKAARMAQALNDPSLQIDPLPFDEETDFDAADNGGFSLDDIEALMTHLQDDQWHST